VSYTTDYSAVEEGSQEVPYSKYKTSTRLLDGFQSFGTPASSIDTSTGRKSLPKMVQNFI